MKTTNIFFEVFLGGIIALVTPNISTGQNGDIPQLEFSGVVSGLNQPIHISNAGDGSNRLFVAQKGGAIRVLMPLGNSLELLSAPLLTITDISPTGEQGLLSVAFHPEFSANGLFFINYVNGTGDIVVDRYTVNTPSGNVADPGSRFEVLVIPHPTFSNHNGGEMHFGTDGLLYISLGDGGGSNDPNDNSQSNFSLLGKILRIDVSVANGGNAYTIPPNNPYGNEVLIKGLRNPFRWSFDSGTGDMWIGDVGQGGWEEINYLSADSLSLEANFGWPYFEGSDPNPGYNGPERPDIPVINPAYKYPIGTARSVIGGAVYRGTEFTSMVGHYIGSDYFSGDIHVFDVSAPATGGVPPIQPTDPAMSNARISANMPSISDFGEAENGDVFAANLNTGEIFLANPEGPLPVELVSFSAKPTKEGSLLSWETAAEKDFERFDIEFSKNAKNWETIGSVSGKRLASGAAYSFVHTTKSRQTLYYRLRMVDVDLSYEYSRLISLNTNEITTFASEESFVFPTVVENQKITVDLSGPYESLELLDFHGKVLLGKNISGLRGEIDFQFGRLPSGVYVVKAKGASKQLTNRIVVR